MQRSIWLSYLACASWLVACQPAENAEDGSTSLTSGISSLGTDGPDGESNSNSGDGDGDGDGDSGDGDGDSGGIKYDMAAFPDVGDDGGMAIPPSCDNIDDFPATSVGCEF